MGYMHINNLYKEQDIFLFRECYALEKVHGTSAHISFSKTPELTDVKYFAGGASYEQFKSLFNHDDLLERFQSFGYQGIVVYGEAYGGKMQGMSQTYGKDLRFIVFDVKIGDNWLSVPDADDVVKKLGLEFVPYVKIPADLESLNSERDRPSRVACLRGLFPRPAEGIVVRPLIELTKNNGDRIMAKHKRSEFSERASKKDTLPSDKIERLAEADKIAVEWVTPMRLVHVLDKIPGPHSIEMTKTVISAMLEDVYREAGDEVVRSKDSDRAIGNLTAKLFKEKLNETVS